MSKLDYKFLFQISALRTSCENYHEIINFDPLLTSTISYWRRWITNFFFPKLNPRRKYREKQLY